MSEEDFSFEVDNTGGSGGGPRHGQMSRSGTQQRRRVAGRAHLTPEGRNLVLEDVVETPDAPANE